MIILNLFGVYCISKTRHLAVWCTKTKVRIKETNMMCSVRWILYSHNTIECVVFVQFLL